MHVQEKSYSVPPEEKRATPVQEIGVDVLSLLPPKRER
jgi:hypothetical protein